MKYFTIEAFSIPDAWNQTIEKIRTEGDKFVVGYGSEETETMKIHITIRIKHPEERPLCSDACISTNMEKIQHYALYYLWSGEKERPDQSYTYGSRLNNAYGDESWAESLGPNQIEAVIDRFVECLFDRQCTMVLRLPSDIKKGFEPPCLTVLDFEILNEPDGKLKMNIEGYFRSWDAYAGLPENLAGLQIFNEAIVKEINERYRVKYGKELGLETGEMIMHSKNVHLYKRHYKLVDAYLGQKVNNRMEVKKHV